MKKQCLILLLVTALFGGFVMLQTGCSKQEEKVVATDSIKIDLRIGVLPTLDALPLYYAQESGIYDSLGIKVELLPYTAQFDCDTALFKKFADVCMMDRLRLTDYRNKGKRLTSHLSINGSYSLLASNQLRAKKIADLNNRTIAIARHSASERFCLNALTKGGLEREQVHFPQINDLWLRADMLTNRQVDAAVLPEPQATLAKLRGHHVLHKGVASADAAMHLVHLSTQKKVKEINLLLEAYRVAKQRIDSQGLATCRTILIKEYKLTEALTDSLISK
ncbi:MAG: ABC transporter substrate-binding protein [Bacteroidaceae bacterium]|nr:ABC transporter substrate-binding protein [Bacteroidaceae bacterium]